MNDKIVVTLKNGHTGKLVKDIHVIFDNYDQYSYTVPVEDISEIKIVKGD